MYHLANFVTDSRKRFLFSSVCVMETGNKRECGKTLQNQVPIHMHIISREASLPTIIVYECNLLPYTRLNSFFQCEKIGTLQTTKYSPFSHFEHSKKTRSATVGWNLYNSHCNQASNCFIYLKPQNRFCLESIKKRCPRFEMKHFCSD